MDGQINASNITSYINRGVPLPGLVYRRKSGRIVQLELEEESKEGDGIYGVDERGGHEEGEGLMFKMG